MNPADAAVIDSLRREWQATEISEAVWPTERWDRLASTGLTRWTLPEEFGGEPRPEADIAEASIELARACLTTMFVLSQRNACLVRIASSRNSVGRHHWMEVVRDGAAYCTVGISHLTTSRQFGRTPAVVATRVPGGYRLQGTIPWVTGGEQASALLTGGVLEDGRQLLAVVNPGSAGVVVTPPEPLLALGGSRTGTVLLNNLYVPDDDVMHGPVEEVMKVSGGGAGSAGTSCLALGATLGTLDRLNEEAGKRPDLIPVVEAIRAEATELRTAILAVVEGRPTHSLDAIRQQANSLVTRTAQTYLAACKGAGFVAGHPAARLIRESMFFYVWACPQGVLMENLRELACGNEPEA